eukprot:scaffold237874_cov27-Tisochrysis_lutea.AAC.2
MAKSSARAATVRSPPDSCSMSRKRLAGGIAVYLIPCKYGSCGSSRDKKAVPPSGTPSTCVRSLYILSITLDTCVNAAM